MSITVCPGKRIKKKKKEHIFKFQFISFSWLSSFWDTFYILYVFIYLCDWAMISMVKGYMGLGVLRVNLLTPTKISWCRDGWTDRLSCQCRGMKNGFRSDTFTFFWLSLLSSFYWKEASLSYQHASSRFRHISQWTQLIVIIWTEAGTLAISLLDTTVLQPKDMYERRGNSPALWSHREACVISCSSYLCEQQLSKRCECKTGAFGLLDPPEYGEQMWGYSLLFI